LGTRAVVKRHLDPDIFKAFIKERGVSIRQLGDLCATTERTIRRCIKDEEVTLTIALDVISTKSLALMILLNGERMWLIF